MIILLPLRYEQQAKGGTEASRQEVEATKIEP
jgi:hypothetical protein